MTRSFLSQSKDQGEVTVAEDETVPRGWGRFMLDGARVGQIPKGSFPLPDKWDTLRLAPADYDDYLQWCLESGAALIIGRA